MLFFLVRDLLILDSMHLHRRDRAVVGGNIRLEIIHESNPCFAGEPICLLIRLKHLGSQHQKESLEKKLVVFEEKRDKFLANLNNDESKPWLMRTLWNTFQQEDKYKDEASLGRYLIQTEERKALARSLGDIFRKKIRR